MRRLPGLLKRLSYYILAFAVAEALIAVWALGSERSQADGYLKYKTDEMGASLQAVIKTCSVISSFIYDKTINSGPALEALGQISRGAGPEHKKSDELTRKKLLDLLGPEFENFGRYNIKYFSVIRIDNTVFLRLHDPGRYDDGRYADPAALRAAAKSGKPARGFDFKDGTLIYDSIFPVMREKNCVGFVRIAIPFACIMDELKALFEGDYFLIPKEKPGAAAAKTLTAAADDHYTADNDFHSMPGAEKFLTYEAGSKWDKYIKAKLKSGAAFYLPPLKIKGKCCIVTVNPVKSRRGDTAAFLGCCHEDSVVCGFMGLYKWRLALGTVMVMIALSWVYYRNCAREIKQQNISEREENRKKFLSMAENVPGVIFRRVESAAGGRFEYVSPRSEAVFGHTPEDFALNPSLPRPLPEDEAAWEKSRAAAMAGLSPWTFEGRFFTKNGGSVTCSLIAKPSRLPDGSAAFDGIIIDVTEERGREEKLARAVFIIEQSPNSIIILGRNGTVEYANPMFTRMTGLTQEETAGKNLLLPGVDSALERLREPVSAAVRSASEWTGEVQGLRKNGAPFWERLTVSPVFAFGRVINYVCVSMDITGRKNAEEELRLAKEAAESGARVKSEFLATMSHEIRTPMNGVIGMAHLLMSSGLNPVQKSYTETIMASGESLLRIINDILDFSKFESGAVKIEKAPFGLARCVEDAIDIFATRAAAKNIDIINLVSPALPKVVISDENRLRQTLVNLIGNSVKFTERGEIVVSAAPGPGKNIIEFTVSDSGIGIRHEDLGRLFNTFTQLDSSLKRRFEGAGLGLVISKKIVEAMGGSIRVESEPGKGSKFTFTIAAEPASEADSFIYTDSLGGLAGSSALIVCPRPIFSKGIAGILDEWDILSVSVSSAEEAFKTLGSGAAFDFVAADLSGSDISSADFADSVIDKYPGLAGKFILICPCDRTNETIERAKNRIGTAAPKPVSRKQLSFALMKLREAQESGGARDDTVSIPVPASAVSAGRSEALSILVAEDNKINQKVALDILSELGHRADLAEDGLKTLEAVKKKKYDAVFMDMSMPEMDGLEAAKRIAEIFPPGERPKIIAMTANAMQGDMEKCLAAGMDDYVSKPVHPEDMENALFRVLGKGGVEPRTDTRKLNAAEVRAPAPDPGDLIDGRVIGSLKKLGGGKLLPDLIKIYTGGDARDNISKIEKAFADGDAAALRKAAHALKGISLNIGAAAMGLAAKKIEDAAAAGDITGRRAGIAELNEILAKTSGALNVILEGLPKPGSKA
jgi:PAS domain S-box-containing protein